ncbi:MAG: nitrite/sulfite reductase, partial [Armatimonadota bacterium]|nr:nitrite/sulfite reductase [Armatimonadota bacterium]
MSDVKLTKEERLKQEKAGLDVLTDIYRYAKTGFDTIEAGDFMRFKWYGIYQQRPNDGRFMMRIKVPGGRLTTDQFRVIADLTQEYARGIADITTRQTLQLHWLTIDQMPDILDRLDAVGLGTAGACGDITRNLTSSPAAGFDPQEIVDPRPVVDALHNFFYKNRDFGNLPRKYKIAVEGSAVQSTLPQINDASLIAYKRPSDGVVGYHFFVGGGLSLQPFFGRQLDIFVPADQIDKIIDVQRAITECYRDAEQLRLKRTRARLKYLMAEWGTEKFTSEVRKKLDWSPDTAAPGFQFSDETYRDHLGVNAQKQPGLNWIGLCILSGRITDEDMRRTCDVADKYGDGEIRLTNVQNILIPHIATEDLPGAQADLAAAGFEWDVPSIRRGAITCTGIEFCNLAITETKLRIKEVVGHLEQVTPNPYERGLKINMNGCPNSCAQHHVGDIGLQGCLARLDDGSQVEAFDIHLGGDIGATPSFTRAIHRKVPAEKVKYALANVIARFKETREGSERFAQWAHRHTNEELDSFLGV